MELVIVASWATLAVILFVVEWWAVLFGRPSNISLRILQAFWKRARWLFGSKEIVHNYGDKAEHGVREASTLLIATIAQAAALIALLKEEGPASLWAILGYIVSASPLLGALAGIVVADADPHWEVPPVHKYDRTTVMFARTYLLLGGIVVLSSASLSAFGQLPGQSRIMQTEIESRHANDHTFKKDGTEGLVLLLKVSKDNFPDGLPREATLVVSFDQDLYNKWKISATDVKTVLGDSVKDMPPENWNIDSPNLTIDITEDAEIDIRGLRDVPDGAYISVKLYLYPRNATASRDLARTQIQKDGAIKVRALYTPG